LKKPGEIKSGWGGARQGAGRKPKATATPPAESGSLEKFFAAAAEAHAGKSPEEIMDLAMRTLAGLGRWEDASKAAARLAAAKARKAQPSAAGKKEAAHATALDRAHGPSPFAVPPPPKTLN